MTGSSSLGTIGLRAITDAPDQALVAVDFDGTLAPIVPDPEQAFADPRACTALGRLGALVGTVAIITGRPTRTAVRLGNLDRFPGLDHLIVLGQYGVERWDARTGEFSDPPVPRQVIAARDAVAKLAASHGADFEDKGRAMAVHFRNAAEPQQTMADVSPAIAQLADAHGLVLEPGRLVIELRAPGMDKGRALRELVAERQARSVLFAGDDLGDLAAFDAIEDLRTTGTPGVTVAVASQEQHALADRADVVVHGTQGFAEWLEGLAERMSS